MHLVLLLFILSLKKPSLFESTRSILFISFSDSERSTTSSAKRMQWICWLFILIPGVLFFMSFIAFSINRLNRYGDSGHPSRTPLLIFAVVVEPLMSITVAWCLYKLRITFLSLQSIPIYIIILFIFIYKCHKDL